MDIWYNGYEQDFRFETQYDQALIYIVYEILSGSEPHTDMDVIDVAMKIKYAEGNQHSIFLMCML